MSRFLSRPPLPSFKREDVSMIGSIKSGAQKPQNERGKVKQRRENSGEKNEKENRKRCREEHDKLHYLEDINNRRHVKRVKFNESCLDACKGDSDLLEKSDLSEEHDPPAFVLKQCYSLGSTQSSNKLRDTDPNRKKQGLVLRIKLPTKKPKDPVTASASSGPYSPLLGTTKPPNIQVGLSDSWFQRKSVPLVEKRKDPETVSAITGPCSSLHHSESSNIRVGLSDSWLQRKNAPSVQKLKHPESASVSTELCSSLHVTKSSNIQVALQNSWLQRKTAPSVQKHKDPEPASASSELCCSLQVTKSSSIQVGLRNSWLQRKNAPSVQKLKDPEPASASSEPCSSLKVTKSSNIQVGLPDYGLQSRNVPLVQIEDLKPLRAVEEPCFSGRASQAPSTSETNLSESRHKSSSRRHGRQGGHRARKSEKLSRDLILCWKPPLQVVETDADDEDWLFAHRKPQHANCRAVVPEPNAFQTTEISLQPRACYMPELDTFQLPYVIPF